jgi:hypothetical protein
MANALAPAAAPHLIMIIIMLPIRVCTNECSHRGSALARPHDYDLEQRS